MEAGKIEVREAVIRTIAMPSDTNPAGDIFGGWLMAQMGLEQIRFRRAHIRNS